MYMNKFKKAHKDHLGPKPISREVQLLKLIFGEDYKPERRIPNRRRRLKCKIGCILNVKRADFHHFKIMMPAGYLSMADLLKADTVGCIMCGYIFHPQKIKEEISKANDGLYELSEGGLVCCPNCGTLNWMITDKMGLPVTKDFLNDTHDYEFKLGKYSPPHLEGYPNSPSKL
jgi:hypothetical protein